LLFVPTTTTSLWDTWVLQEDGTFFLFYLASSRSDRPWDSVALATSTDGVHFTDRGVVIEKAPDAMWLGAGMGWRVGDKYMHNFSESRNGRLSIFIAESDDLLHWTRLDDSYECKLDPRWYAEDGTEFSDQRWDNIWVLERDDGDGFFGYVTAVAKDGPIGLRGTAATVTSTDGRHFVAGPPAIPPGVWGDKLEIGSVERIGDAYYMLAAQAEIPLGLRWSAHHPAAVGGVYALRSDRLEGPFTLDPRQRPLLVSAPQHYTYYARYCRTDDALLVSHHSITPVRDIVNVNPKPGSYLAPMKEVRCDDGLLQLVWWKGNDALLGRQLPVLLGGLEGRGLTSAPVSTDGQICAQAPAGGMVVLPSRYDLERGVSLDADLSLSATNGGAAGIGVFIEGQRAWSGTVLLADTDGQFSIGPFNGYAYRTEDSKKTEINPKLVSHWRALIRGTFVELYVDDRLVQCFTLPALAVGRLGFVVESGEIVVEKITVRELTL
jgi:hypothetical protein